MFNLKSGAHRSKNCTDKMSANKKSFLLNAFSLQMVNEANFDVHCTEISQSELPKDLESAVGHADTAAVLGVECNRISVQLHKGDTAFVAQLIGGRLPEGSTTLPEGFRFKFLKVEIS